MLRVVAQYSLLLSLVLLPGKGGNVFAFVNRIFFYWKSCQRTLMKLLEGWDVWLDFGADPDPWRNFFHCWIAEIVRILRNERPWWRRFTISECFKLSVLLLVVVLYGLHWIVLMYCINLCAYMCLWLSFTNGVECSDHLTNSCQIWHFGRITHRQQRWSLRGRRTGPL